MHQWLGIVWNRACESNIDKGHCYETGATFQRLLDGILVDLPFCVVTCKTYFVFSSLKEEHLHHLCIELDHVQQNGLVVRFSGSFLDKKTTPKDALDIWSAEMVCGDPLIVPAEFFPSAASSDKLQPLCHAVGKSTPCHKTYKSPAKQLIPTDLHSSTHVCICTDTSKSPVMPPYTGLLPMIRCTAKAFLHNMRGKEDCVSIDCLQPAYLLPDDPPKVHLS
ncbi:uncharacterized protein [Palaemon carinicauda]|uniref:uncharacterized protein n=1 Tax=Palaemon carinicauda TaxID=392227 RepID=UPI0035B61247